MAPSALPDFLATMGLTDSRPRPLAVMHSRWRLIALPRDPLRRASQVPLLICPCALSPLTPESPATARALCFVAGVRLPPHPADWPLPSRNEAETGLLALRLAGWSFEASPKRIAPLHARLTTCRMGNYMVSSFHLTRSARLVLAHQMNADEHRLTTKGLSASIFVNHRPFGIFFTRSQSPIRPRPKSSSQGTGRAFAWASRQTGRSGLRSVGRPFTGVSNPILSLAPDSVGRSVATPPRGDPD